MDKLFLDVGWLYWFIIFASAFFWLGLIMSDSSDDMELASASLFCKECYLHFEECDCEESDLELI